MEQEQIKNDYYVYGYIRLDTNTYFYIGKGRRRRCYEFCGRTEEFTNILNSVPCAVEFLYKDLTEEEALYYENFCIENLVFNEGYSMGFDIVIDTTYNYLTNKTYGGSGILGYKFTPQQIQRAVRRSEEHPMYGIRGKDHPIYGRNIQMIIKIRLENLPH